jgi:polyhydroxyalkanoate synthase
MNGVEKKGRASESAPRFGRKTMARKPVAQGQDAPAKKTRPPAKTGAAKPRPATAAKPKAEKAAPVPPRPTEAPPLAQAAASPMDPSAFLTSEQRRTLEALSINLAKASLTAQGALASALARQGDSAALPSADPFHIAPALTQVMGKLAMNPEKVMRAQADLFDRYMELWRRSAARLGGETAEPVATPAKGDKRFNDPDWSENPVFDVMKQSYLLTSNWLNGLVSDVEDVEPLTKRRVEFFTKMLTDAFSPSNFLVSNPAALREAMQSQGESLLRGAQNFAADLARGGGQLAISQTDAQRFKVGENVATAPGKVVFRNDLFELLQFSPSTEEVYEVPLLIFPPWINKYYILDLRPENSMIRWLTGQGFTVFVTSWVNPDASLSGKTIEDYMTDGVYAAVEQVLEQTGAKTVNAVGYCIGGTLLSCALAHMAARGDERIGAATFFAAQQDFEEAGDLLLFTNDEWLKDLEGRIDAAGGVLPSGAMADTFNALRANDLIWSFFVNNYLMGKEPAAFDLLFWNSDQTRMPKALHMSYLADFYRDNRLAKGELVIDNVRLDLKAVTIPIYVQSSKEDHIAPFRSVYRGAKLFGGPVTFMMAGSGHIAGVINHPDAKKYQHWTNPDLPTAVEDWQAGAAEHPGSWWPNWSAWLAARSGDKVTARDPAMGPLKPLEDAPGSYVKVRSNA